MHIFGNFTLRSGLTVIGIFRSEEVSNCELDLLIKTNNLFDRYPELSSEKILGEFISSITCYYRFNNVFPAIRLSDFQKLAQNIAMKPFGSADSIIVNNSILGYKMLHIVDSIYSDLNDCEELKNNWNKEK